MEELKTLKDIDFITTYVDLEGENKRKFIGERELKQEAIKWIKSYGDYAGKESAKYFIKTFFNITKEDLKERK